MSTKVTIIERLLFIASILFQQFVAIVIGVILTVIINNSDIKSYNTWHIILCTIGYAFFMAEAIVAFSKHSIFTINLNRKTNGTIHGILMGLATLFVTTGISLKIYQKNQSSTSEHFVSNHAITGLVSWILALTALIFGVLANNAIHLRNIVRPVWIKLIHNFIGISSYAIGMACLALGLYKTSFKAYTVENTRLALVYVIAILTVYSLIGAFRSLYDQIKTSVKG